MSLLFVTANEDGFYEIKGVKPLSSWERPVPPKKAIQQAVENAKKPSEKNDAVCVTEQNNASTSRK